MKRMPAGNPSVYVLHCFRKTTQKTSKADLDLATKRYRELTKEFVRRSKKYLPAWDAIEDTPEKAENMKLRSSLMIA